VPYEVQEGPVEFQFRFLRRSGELPRFSVELIHARLIELVEQARAILLRRYAAVARRARILFRIFADTVGVLHRPLGVSSLRTRGIRFYVMPATEDIFVAAGAE